ncbi:MAG: transposase, partial [Pseudomonadota bacterium]
MAKRTRRSYDAEFKRNAVALSHETGRTVADIAESLGISVDLLYRWRQESDAHGKIAFPGKGNPMLTDQERKIRDLEKRLKNAEIERDILKK